MKRVKKEERTYYVGRLVMVMGEYSCPGWEGKEFSCRTRI